MPSQDRLQGHPHQACLGYQGCYSWRKTMKREILIGGILLISIIVCPRDLVSATGDEYANIVARYGKIHTIAGRGTLDSNGGNDWLESYEGGSARAAELSEAHNAQADVFGNVYIVDKDSHAVRKVTTDG